VIDSPEVLSVIDTMPHLRPFLSCLHACQYAAFFQVGGGGGGGAQRACSLAGGRTLARNRRPASAPARTPLPTPQAFAGLADSIRDDPYLHPHFRHYMREVRAAADAQVSQAGGG
jgi:26S proteasome regulatory subunit N7